MTPENAIKSGWYIFPCRWRGGHRPLVKWGTAATNDPAVLSMWRDRYPDAYYCVAATRSGISIYDIDDKHGKHGSVTHVTHELMHGPMPETLTVETPSGGRHLYFAGPSGVGVCRYGDGIDAPVMAPLPGSDVPGKGIYRVVKFLANGSSLPALPQWAREMAGAPRLEMAGAPSLGAEAPTITLDNPPDVAAAVSYLRGAPAAIEGSGGDTTAYRVACAVRDYGLSEGVCHMLMVRYYMDRCIPGGAEWIRDKVANAYQYARAALADTCIGSGFASMDDDDDPAGGGDGIASALVGWGDIDACPPPRRWVVPGMIPLGEVTAFYGAGGTGKSLLSLQLVMSITAKVEWLDHYKMERFETLYVSCEDDEEELKRRAYNIKALNFMATQGAGDLRLWSRAGDNNVIVGAGGRRGPFYADLCRMIETMGDGHKVIVIDNISDVFAGDENSRSEVSQFIKRYLKGLCLRYDCTIVLIGHVNKAGQVSGSTGWVNSCRSQIQISAHDNANLPDYRRIWTGKSNYGSSGAGTEFLARWTDGVFRRVDPGSVTDPQKEMDMDLMMQAIERQARTGEPYGHHHNAALYVHGGLIVGGDGKPMSKDRTKCLLAALIQSGDVVVVKGQSRGNGVWPAGGV